MSALTSSSARVSSSASPGKILLMCSRRMTGMFGSAGTSVEGLGSLRHQGIWPLDGGRAGKGPRRALLAGVGTTCRGARLVGEARLVGVGTSCRGTASASSSSEEGKVEKRNLIWTTAVLIV